MNCPFCRNDDTRVIDSRASEDRAAIRRRRQCPSCNQRFTTVETVSLLVVKRSGVIEPFNREKVLAGVRKACQGRPVSEDALALLTQEVEQRLRSTGSAAIASQDVGLAILEPLRTLDEVAYLRFASVYRSFDSLDDFQNEIAMLRGQSVLREQRISPERQGDQGRTGRRNPALDRGPTIDLRSADTKH